MKKLLLGAAVAISIVCIAGGVAEGYRNFNNSADVDEDGVSAANRADPGYQTGGARPGISYTANGMDLEIALESIIKLQNGKYRVISGSVSPTSEPAKESYVQIITDCHKYMDISAPADRLKIEMTGNLDNLFALESESNYDPILQKLEQVACRA